MAYTSNNNHTTLQYDIAGLCCSDMYVWASLPPPIYRLFWALKHSMTHQTSGDATGENPPIHTQTHTHPLWMQKEVLALAILPNLSLTMRHDLAHAGLLLPLWLLGFVCLLWSPLLHITFDLCVLHRLLLSGFLYSTHTHTVRSLGTATPACSFISCKPQETERQQCLLCFVTL